MSLQRRGDDPPSREEKDKEVTKSKLPVTPSVDMLGMMTGSRIFIEEMEKPSDRVGSSEEQMPYAGDCTIYPDM